MTSFMQRTIIFALIFAIAIPISIAHRKKSSRHRRESDWEDDSHDSRDDSEIERYLRDLCSDTINSKQCWKIIEPEITRFTNTDSRNVADVVIDLAIAKSGEINDQLNQLHRDSDNEELKEKYISCSKNYNDANRNLVIVRRNVDAEDFRGVSAEIDDASEELESCKHDFGGNSFDPAHIRDRNKEFGQYLEIVKAATNRFVTNIDRKN